MKYLIVGFGLILSACAKENKSNPAPLKPTLACFKSILSTWTAEKDGFTMDVSHWTFTPQDGSIDGCNVTRVLSGDECNGSLNQTSSCPEQNYSYSYAIDSSGVWFCMDGQCERWK